MSEKQERTGKIEVSTTFTCSECGNTEEKIGKYEELADSELKCPDCGAILN